MRNKLCKCLRVGEHWHWLWGKAKAEHYAHKMSGNLKNGAGIVLIMLWQAACLFSYSPDYLLHALR
jgi:hypothetical protein